MNDENKLIIYQVFTRLFGNNNNHCINNGSITENGCGKMADFTAKALGEIKEAGGYPYMVHRHHRACNANGLPPLTISSPNHPAIVKGKAGFRHMPSRTTMMSIRIWPRTFRSV